MMDWKTVQGSQPTKPEEFDTTSSEVVVYQRRNVHIVEVEDMEGTKTTLWEYDERELTKDEFMKLSLQNALSAIANIEDALCDMDMAG